MVTMRIASMRGAPVADLEKKGVVPKWVFAARVPLQLSRAARRHGNRRRRRSGSRAPFDGKGPAPISLEKKIAGDLHLGVGDDLVMDVQGVPVRGARRQSCGRWIGAS